MKTKKKEIANLKYKKAHGCRCFRSVRGVLSKLGRKCKYPHGGYQRKKVV